MSSRSARFLFCLLVLFFFFSTHAGVLAQEEPSFAVAKIIDDTEAKTGDIISFTAEGKFIRTATSFDPYLYGVIGDTATVVYYPTEQGVPVIRNGEALVNVTTLTGDIKPGDYITSSSIPGKGQRTSIRDGSLLGVALSAFKEGEGTKTQYEEREISLGSVRVMLDIGPAAEGSAGNVSKLVDQLALSLLKNVQTPTGTNSFFRFLLATLIAIAGIAIGFGSFGRNVTRGIEAIGRNPLAKRQIQAMIILNIGLIGFISIAGIILALAIIRY